MLLLFFYFFYTRHDVSEQAERTRTVSLSEVRLSHASTVTTVVPEWFKDDNASQWKSGKFDPRSIEKP